ncbi:MAG: glycosyltransferase [Clostridiales bacterium]|nr:glycosyltransferase [Clostridiales bacterium]
MKPLTLDQLTPPYVSVVVPVYNVENYLRRCLDSLVYQTLQDIEIIVVNDCSPDNSQAIIDEYVARYPDKVRCICHEENQGLALARKTGFLAARAPYVLFHDSDDFLDGRTCEDALALAVSENHDMVGINSTAWDEEGGHYPYRNGSEEYDISTMVRKGPAAFWQYLFRREFLENKDVFIPVIFEDACIMPWIFTQARSIGWLPHLFQHMYTQRKDSIMATFLGGQKKVDLLLADTRLWSKAEEPYKSDFAFRIASRMYGNCRKYSNLYVESVKHIQSLFPQLEPCLPEDISPHVLEFLQSVLQLPSEPPVPSVVYLNDFAGAASLHNDPTAVFDDWHCVALNESNCDLDSAPAFIRQAYDEGRMEDVAVYFAMQRIEQEGGMYAAPQTHLQASAASLRYETVFFPAGCDDSVSLHFFGGAPGNRLMRRILRIWQDGAGFVPAGATMTEQVTNLLYAEYNVHLRGNGERGLNGVYILPAHRCVIPGVKSFCYINAAPAEEAESLITQPMDAYLASFTAMEHEVDRADERCIEALQTINKVKEHRDLIKQERDEAKKERNLLKKECVKLRKEQTDLRKQRDKLKQERNQLKKQRDEQAALARRYDSLLNFSLVGWVYKLYKRIKK